MTIADIFTDAIEVIAATPTGQGNIHLGGVPAYNQRYGDYATRTLALLREYRQEGDEITFAALPESKHADSDRRWGANIRINSRFRQSTGVVAVLLMHEGCHLLRDVRLFNKVEQEVICRTLGVCLYRDLIAGVSITSSSPEWRGSSPPRATMTSRNFPVTLHIALPAQDAPIELSIQNHEAQANRLVDWVIAHGYHDELTADWISHSIEWWGGLRNRLPATKGHFLRCLAGEGETYGELILRILESLTGTEYRHNWDAMVRGAAVGGGVDDEMLRRSLRRLRAQPAAAARIRAIEECFPVDLGCGGTRRH